MNKSSLLALAAALFACTGAWAEPSTTLQLTSNDFVTGGNIPRRLTGEGENLSPTLRIQDPPAATKSFALIVDDPDAPGGTFTHWLVWNIPADTTDWRGNDTPSGAVQGKNDFGKIGYGGPRPPSGQHRYYFHLYALDGELKLPAGAERDALEQAMKGHILGQTELMGTYHHGSPH